MSNNHYKLRFYARKRFFLYALTFITLLAACSKKNDVVTDPVNPPPTTTPPKSDSKTLTGITITKADNPAFTADGYVYKAGNKFYITLPLGSNLTVVKTNFAISDKAKIKANGTLLSSTTSNLDLSVTQEIEIQAEDGSTANYTILAQTGIKDIDQMIYPFIEKYGIPAAAYAIGKNSLEDIVYKNASGYAVTETKERAKPNTLFRLASMSKQHTAIAIMTLIQQGKIAIDDLVFGPTGILKASFSNVGPMSSRVTVRHLLEHTAGYTGDPMFNGDGATLDQKIQTMLNSTQKEPGTSFYYYNMGYGTLGKIIEVVSGKDYETYLKEIYAPAGVTIQVASTAKAQRRVDEAAYYAQNGSSGYGNDMNVVKAAAGVLINTENLFKVLYSVDGGNIKTDILTPAIRTLMFTPSTVTNGYAKGWRTNHSLFKGFYHGGNVSGTATFWIYGEEYSVSVLLNSRSEDSNFDVDLIVLTNNIMKKAKELNL